VLLRNFYFCPLCRYEWTALWSVSCSDECRNCGALCIVPHKNELLSEARDTSRTRSEIERRVSDLCLVVEGLNGVHAVAKLAKHTSTTILSALALAERSYRRARRKLLAS
jgi:hypothetical protein